MALAINADRMTVFGLMGSQRARTLIHVSRSLHYAAVVSRTTGTSGWLEMEQLADRILRDHDQFVESDQACSNAHQEATRLLSQWEWQVEAANETRQ
ncbi:hypothetical protein J2W42_002926 [Rhizobium tibeticum]|jgi:hypothetical protein|nr:hypothetical protein [Rhizobium tibeticum]